MTPAKGEASNVVTASLGPVPEGIVEVRTEKREPGDILVVCSDGVADRVTPDFNDALRRLMSEASSAAEVVASVLDEFERRPEVFDDNLSLGLLATPRSES